MRTLPIRWATVTELRSGRRAIQAQLRHQGVQYDKVEIPPLNAAPKMIELIITMMRLEIEGAVESTGARL